MAILAPEVAKGHITAAFHDLFYDQCQFVSWLGVPAQKTPFDLMVYQEIICDTKPDLLIETGTQTGGSAWFYATIMDLLGHGQVITIDNVGEEFWRDRPTHDRIEYVTSGSTDPEIHDRLREEIEGKRVMVSLDSDHSYEHVFWECQLYGQLVTPGCYMVVEDTNVSGAAQAAAEFVEGNDEWEVDLEREKYLLTFHPGGWLRKR